MQTEENIFLLIECPSCGAVRCHSHCNNCGISIRWRKDEYYDKWKMYKDGTEIEHKCMQQGTKSGLYLKDGKWLQKEREWTPEMLRTYNWHQQHMPCTFCGGIFNKEKSPLCPSCFRLECRDCGNLQQWINIQPSFICNVCEGMCDVRQIKYLEVPKIYSFQ